MYCSGKREIKNNRVFFFHNATQMHRWRERGVGHEASKEMQREKRSKALDIKRILTVV